MGKTAWVVAATLLVWAAIIWKLGANLVIDAMLFVGGIVVTGLCFWFVRATYAFAHENPAIALLEGGELVDYQRIEAQMKGGVPPGIAAAPGAALITSPIKAIEGEAAHGE